MINKDFKFKKSLGQNFLNDDNIVDKIANAAKISKNDLVIEIGPGSGVLTKKLALLAGQVLAYEIDLRLKEDLNKNLSNVSNVDILYKDFMQADVLSDLKKYKFNKLYIVSNLPYYITTPIINKLINDKLDIECIVVMVQKEVALRFCALPGTKDYNSLTIYLGYHYNIKKLFDVSKNCFIPKPNVDSAVVCFEKRKEKEYIKDINFFYKIVRDSFSFKRKTLKNNLKGYNLIKIEEILKKYNMDLSVRAEQISLNIFIEIANHLCD